MKTYQQAFITLARDSNALKFGAYTLKSGRVSPYFFNAGAFHTGGALATLGRCYADAIVASGVEFDLLFGPAYKGIPLAASVSIALSDRHGRDVPWVYNRKEAKDHGEGGQLVGAPLAGRVLVVDDVITAGTAVREVLGLIDSAGAQCAGVAIGLARMERGQTELSPIQELERDRGLQVISIVTLLDLIEYLRERGDAEEELAAMLEYRSRYGVT